MKTHTYIVLGIVAVDAVDFTVSNSVASKVDTFKGSRAFLVVKKVKYIQRNFNMIKREEICLQMFLFFAHVWAFYVNK